MKRIEWNKVTWYSKLLAVVVFVVVFWVGMGIGMEYQYAVDEYNATMKKIYPVGVTVNRCGGFIRNAPVCPTDYHCVLGKIPDTGGICMHD